MGVVMRHEIVVTDSTDGTTLKVGRREGGGDEGLEWEIVAATSSGGRTERLYVSLADLESLRLSLGNLLDAEGFHPTSPDDPWLNPDPREGEGPRDAGTPTTSHRHPL